MQPLIGPPGGGPGVAAWMAEALSDRYDLTLLTWWRVDAAALDRYYGTSLVRKRFRALAAPAAWRALVALSPASLSLLQLSLLLRRSRRFSSEYDLAIAAANEVDFGRRGIQYVHHPWNYRLPDISDLRWYHGSVRVAAAYQLLCARVCDYSAERMKRNLTLVNSDWTGSEVARRHGIESLTLYPPAAGTFRQTAWEARENGFLCIGRLSPEKEIERVIEILAGVRACGHPVRLRVIGSPGDRSYERRIRRRVREHASWVSLEMGISRSRLVSVIDGHRYGIHGMKEEHLGMAVAEMVRGGCIVFAPRGGGQVEIIGEEDRLLYSSADDAVEKIVRTLESPDVQEELRQHLAVRGELFTAERFMQRTREIVGEFAAATSRRSDRRGPPCEGPTR